MNNCSVCGRPLHGGVTVHRCECGAVTHSRCWEQHVIKSHTLPFTLGTVTKDDVFKPRELPGKKDEGATQESDC